MTISATRSTTRPADPTARPATPASRRFVRTIGIAGLAATIAFTAGCSSGTTSSPADAALPADAAAIEADVVLTDLALDDTAVPATDDAAAPLATPPAADSPVVPPPTAPPTEPPTNPPPTVPPANPPTDTPPTAPPILPPPVNPPTNPPVISPQPTRPPRAAAPVFESFDVSAFVPCPPLTTVGSVTVSWSVTGAESIYVAIDNVDGPYETGLPATGSIELPRPCNDANTYYVVATNPSGRTVMEATR